MAEEYNIPNLPKAVITEEKNRTVVCAAAYDKLKIYMDKRNLSFKVLSGKNFPEDLKKETTVLGYTCRNSMCVESRVGNIFEICEALPYYSKEEL